MVVEADEYDYSFLWLRPEVAIITNIDYDHPDIFPDQERYDAAFARFAASVRPGGTLVLAADDPGCARLRARATSGTRTGSSPSARPTTPIGDWRAREGDWRVATPDRADARIAARCARSPQRPERDRGAGRASSRSVTIRPKRRRRWAASPGSVADSK